MSPAERFALIHQRLQERRAEVHGGGPMATVATVANLLPTWVVTSLIRTQAGHIDFATSNLPGFLGDTWVAGARTLHTYAWGPVAGPPSTSPKCPPPGTSTSASNSTRRP